MNRKQGFCSVTTILVILICIVPIILMSIWTDRTLDFWCSYFSHHAVNIPMWLSIIVTLIGNGVVFVLNIMSEIVRLCI